MTTTRTLRFVILGRRTRRAFGRNEGRGEVEAFELARVRPPAVEHVVLHRVRGDVSVIDVGDFEFVPLGRLERPDIFEDAMVVKIDTRHGVTALGKSGLLIDAYDAIALDLRDAEAFGVFDFFEEHARARALRFD